MPAAPRSCAGRPRSRWGRDSRRSWDLLRGLAIVRGVAVAHALAIFRSTSREPRAKLQPGTIAEKRPAVPPATTIFRLSGSRNFGIRVVSVSGGGNLRRDRKGVVEG